MVMQSCAISYKFNGASIDYSTTKSIAIAEFPNQATLVYPQLSSMLSETIRDIYSRQTRLEVTRRNGDLELEGEITGYTLTAMAIAADSYAAETKLTITVRVRFTNNNAPEDNFEKTVSKKRCKAGPEWVNRNDQYAVAYFTDKQKVERMPSSTSIPVPPL